MTYLRTYRRQTMTTNKPEVVTMGDRYPESGCYQCGRLKTALNYRSRCLTCETQRADANADENDELRTQLSDCEALQAELETVKKVAYGNIELLERNEALQAECDALVEALESILHGSLLDACGNRDDDGISSAISMGIQRDSLQRWRKIASQALATYRNGDDL